MKTILVGAAAFGCVTGPSGAGENGNPRLHGLTADGAVLLAESRNPYILRTTGGHLRYQRWCRQALVEDAPLHPDRTAHRLALRARLPGVAS